MITLRFELFECLLPRERTFDVSCYRDNQVSILTFSCIQELPRVPQFNTIANCQAVVAAINGELRNSAIPFVP